MCHLQEPGTRGYVELAGSGRRRHDRNELQLLSTVRYLQICQLPSCACFESMLV